MNKSIKGNSKMNTFAKITSILMTIAATMTGGAIANAASLKDTAAATYQLHLGPEKGWGSDHTRFHCSAVAVSPTQLVTAAHCIPTQIKDRKLIITIDDKRGTELLSRLQLPVSVLRVTYDDDTAMIELKTDKFAFSEWVDLAETYTPFLGDPVYALGYPRGDVLTLTEGMYTATVSLEAEMGVKGEYYKVTVPITGGSSGGGLYTREWDPIAMEWDYRLVGIATAAYRDVSFQSYFSTTEAVHKVIKGLLRHTDE